jgi:hypothetical protein
LLKTQAVDKKQALSEQVNQQVERSQLEGLFVECIEQVRKEIMRRRLKSEIF